MRSANGKRSSTGRKPEISLDGLFLRSVKVWVRYSLVDLACSVAFSEASVALCLREDDPGFSDDEEREDVDVDVDVCVDEGRSVDDSCVDDSCDDKTAGCTGNSESDILFVFFFVCCVVLLSVEKEKRAWKVNVEQNQSIEV